jgi:photosystem II stability/assembly factor-like uncharacterized protein
MKAKTLLLAASLLAAPNFGQDARLQSWARHVQMRDQSPFRGLHWQSLGPRFQGGRVETIAAVPGTGTIYAGFGSGSLWKTVNNGLTWTPIFDDQPTGSIGDLALAPSDPRIIYVGTGENLLARSSFAGMGVFKSLDAGATWTHMGLTDTHHIGRVAIHPKNPDIVFVAALGHLFTPNEERGVFRTKDGGRTWKKVLYVSDRVGAADVVFDPEAPDTVYASTAEHERKAWNNVEQGPGSGVYKSVDGGETWKRVSGGLPGGPFIGRIGLAVAPSAPATVYAFLSNQTPVEETRPDGKRTVPTGPEVYRSDDRGETWRKRPMKSGLDKLGFYGDIVVSPDDPEMFYALGVNLHRSEDGGRTFWNMHGLVVHLYDHPSPALHLDQHDLWIDPSDPKHLILGNDGGVYVSTDRGATWLHLNNIPTGEFYALSVDEADPYFIYGGTQDDSALLGPANRAPLEGVKDPWRYVWIDLWGGGDSYVTAVDPADPATIYFEQQFGDFQRKNLRTGESKRIRPPTAKGEPELRFNWMSPFLISRHNPGIVYIAANKLFRSLNRGDDWIGISPDLTTRPGPERQGNVPYGTITTISESPLRPGLLYVGTDDGRVWLTRNDGAEWMEIGKGLPLKWISRVVASGHDLGTAYVTLTGYRENDYRPYVFKTSDFGATWESLAAGLPEEQVNVLREDPGDSRTLYLGTDQGGVFATKTGGKSWLSLCADLPPAAVHDLAVQARERELVIATHGRSVYKLDLAPVQDFSEEIAARPVHIFAIRPAVLPQARDYGGDWALETRIPAVIHYALKKAGPVTLRVLDEKGVVLLERTETGREGINSTSWDLVVGGGYASPAVLGPGAKLAGSGSFRVEVRSGEAAAAGILIIRKPARPKVGGEAAGDAGMNHRTIESS